MKGVAIMNFLKMFLFIFSIAYLTGCSEATSTPQYKYKEATEDGVALKSGKITVSNEEVMKGIESELFEAQMKVFDIKFNKAKQVLIEKLIAADPKSKSMTRDQYFEKFIASKVKVTDKEINEFIEERKIPKDRVEGNVKAKIVQFLKMQKKEEAVKDWLGEKTDGKPIEVFIKKPNRPTFDVKVGDAPTYGSPSAKVTIVEFSDFQCPYCAQGAKVITQLKKKYGNKIQVAFKQYPLPFHSQAKMAAVASMCVHEQNKSLFWKMHDEMFANQDKLSIKELKALAEKLGADTKKFNKCLDDKKYLAHVEKDIQEGKDIGVKSTPTFYINGQLVAGALPVESFSEIIDEELAK